MSLAFQQTATDANASALAALCSGASLNSIDTESSLCEVGGAAGAAGVFITMQPSASNLAAVWMELDVPDDISWDAGDWTFRFNVTQANANITLEAIYICRVDSSYNSVATIGSDSASGLLNKTGVVTRTISGAAQSPSAGDKVVIVVLFSNSQATTQAFGWTRDQIITAPFTEESSQSSSSSASSSSSSSISSSSSSSSSTSSVSSTSSGDIAYPRTATNSNPDIAGATAGKVT